jgi:hypothetical protein
MIEQVMECEHLPPRHCFTASIAGRSRPAATSIFREVALRRIAVALVLVAIARRPIKAAPDSPYR